MRTSDIAFSWNANTEPDLAGYKLYVGRASGVYTASGSPKNMGTATSGTFTIDDNGVWYFALTAIDTSNNESGYSTEVSRDWLLLGNF